MRRILIFAAFVFLASLPIGASLAQNDQHKDQPKSCDNGFDNPHKCDCERAQHDCDPNNQYASQKCKTYCRPEACKCVNPCNTLT